MYNLVHRLSCLTISCIKVVSLGRIVWLSTACFENRLCFFAKIVAILTGQ